MERLIVAVAVAVLAGVVALGLLVPPPDENRTLTSFPPVASLVTLEDEALSQAATALVDRSGLRGLGVDADRAIRRELLGDRVYDQYVVGEDGWLFYRKVVEQACERGSPAPAIRREAERLAAVAASAGLQVAVVVGPDKAAVHTDQLGPFEPEGRCVADHARDLAALGAPVVTGLDEVRSVAADDGPAYFPQDTHWRYVAAARASRPVFELVAPELVGRLELRRTGTAPRELDLERFAGRTVRLEEPVWVLGPPGATITSRGAVGPALEQLTVEGGGVPDRDVVLSRDSFGESMIPSLANLGSRMTVCSCDAGIDGRLAPALADAEVLVLVSVQRNATAHLRGTQAAGHLATALGDRLQGTDLAVGADGTLRLPAAGVVRFSFEGLPTAVRLVGSDGRVQRDLDVRDGHVASVFVEDVDVDRVRVEVEGARLTGAEAIGV